MQHLPPEPTVEANYDSLTCVNFGLKCLQRNASGAGEENSWKVDEGDIFTLYSESSTLMAQHQASILRQ